MEQKIEELEKRVVQLEKKAATVMTAMQPKKIQIQTVIDPTISENTFTIDEIIRAINERIIPALELHHEVLQNQYAVLASHGLVSEQLIKGNYNPSFTCKW